MDAARETHPGDAAVVITEELAAIVLQHAFGDVELVRVVEHNGRRRHTRARGRVRFREAALGAHLEHQASVLEAEVELGQRHLVTACVLGQPRIRELQRLRLPWCDPRKSSKRRSSTRPIRGVAVLMVWRASRSQGRSSGTKESSAHCPFVVPRARRSGRRRGLQEPGEAHPLVRLDREDGLAHDGE